MDKQDTVATGDRLEMIFKRQAELMFKFKAIEDKAGLGRGLLKQMPNASIQLNIDNQKFQYVCKDFAWRITEEITETTEALALRPGSLQVVEEVVDVLHFLVELMLLNGITPGKIMEATDTPNFLSNDALANLFQSFHTDPVNLSYNSIGGIERRIAYHIIEKLGMAMACLKLRPWKNRPVKTDKIKYITLLCSVFRYWVMFARSLNMTSQDVFDHYFRKSETNKTRIRNKH